MCSLTATTKIDFTQMTWRKKEYTRKGSNNKIYLCRYNFHFDNREKKIF